MKRLLLSIACSLIGTLLYSQTIYYWVGGTNASTGINTAANWNTAPNGTGTSRPSSTGASDILIFDGTNVGGATPATGTVNLNVSSSITCAQMKFVNNATVIGQRPTTGTSTITIAGEAGDDFIIEAGSSMTFGGATGSQRVTMSANTTGRVAGTLNVTTSQQMRFENGTGGAAGSFIVVSGASVTSNITAASSYIFGSNTQSAEKWVVFEDGAHLYYEGGNSPMGSNSAYSPIDFKPNSVWHHRSNNGAGSFFNRKSFGHISVENAATLTSDGPIYRINNLTINSGCTFITHTSAETVIMGNIVADGTLSSPAAGGNKVILAGINQTVSGTGTIHVNGLLISDKTSSTFSKSAEVDDRIDVIGKVNMGINQFTGSALFAAKAPEAAINGTGNLTSGTYIIRGNVGVPASSAGYSITGTGIPANTVVVSISGSGDSIFVSQPVTATATGTALAITANGATLQTAHANGFGTGGSVATTGNLVYNDNINYIINGATTTPFGNSTGGNGAAIHTAFVEVTAPITINRSFSVSNHLTVSGKIRLRATDTLYVLSGAVVNGTINSSNYIATDYTVANGDHARVKWDGITAATLVPIGTPNNYLPATVTPTGASNMEFYVFEGITLNGLVNGTALSPAQKQRVVDAVWNVSRSSGTGNVGLQLQWTTGLEGSSFTTLPNSDIGVIQNTGSGYTTPLGTGNNTTNTASATATTLGSFGIGAIPQANAFVFNPLPAKTYGDADFSPGATSLNTTQPIVYTSSNTAVATIVSGNIHITGAGTTTITATQASDGVYPAASASQPLTVSKANLTIRADDKSKVEGQANPTLTATYTGFVLGETSAALLTQATLSTTATVSSTAGTYPITVAGATSNNYNITFTAGVLTVSPRLTQTITFNALPTKVYGNADFAAGATTTNATIPITYSSSNTAVATIVGSNIHIVGAGTATITASQAGNVNYFPATDKQQTLTVNKAALTIRVRDTSRLANQPNPAFTITYTGFVLGETVANLTTAPTPTTTATLSSSPGLYPITLEGAASNNYTITTVPGRLTVLPAGGASVQSLNVYMSNSSTLTVRVYQPNPTIADIYVYDIAGRPLMRRNVFLPTGFISFDIPAGRFPAGIYFVKLYGDGVNLQQSVRILK